LKKDFRSFPWHTLLFAVFPILSLLSANTGQVDYTAATRSLILSVTVSVVILLGAKSFLRDWQKAGVLVTAWSVLFYSYGHVHTLIKNMEVAGVLIGRHRVLGAVWLVLMFTVTWWAVQGNHKVLTSSLNLVTVFLLVFPVYTLISFWYSSRSVQEAGPKVDSAEV